MKKLFLLLVLVMAFSLLFCSCTKDKEEVEDDIMTEEERIEALFDTKIEESVGCYYSLYTDEGYENYILAFPTKYIEGYQKELGYTDEQFDEAMKNATEVRHNMRDETYEGATYHIDYVLVNEGEFSESYERDILDSLSAFCHIPYGTVSDMKKMSYSVTTYGVDEDTSEIVNEETRLDELCLIYIKGDGWYVSPTHFEFS